MYPSSLTNRVFLVSIIGWGGVVVGCSVNTPSLSIYTTNFHCCHVWQCSPQWHKLLSSSCLQCSHGPPIRSLLVSKPESRKYHVPVLLNSKKKKSGKIWLLNSLAPGEQFEGLIKGRHTHTPPQFSLYKIWLILIYFQISLGVPHVHSHMEFMQNSPDLHQLSGLFSFLASNIASTKLQRMFSVLQSILSPKIRLPYFTWTREVFPGVMRICASPAIVGGPQGQTKQH